MRETMEAEHIRNIGLCIWECERIHLIRGILKYHDQVTELKPVAVSFPLSLRLVGMAILGIIAAILWLRQGVLSWGPCTGIVQLKTHSLHWVLKYVCLVYPMFFFKGFFKNLETSHKYLNFYLLFEQIRTSGPTFLHDKNQVNIHCSCALDPTLSSHLSIPLC